MLREVAVRWRDRGDEVVLILKEISIICSCKKTVKYLCKEQNGKIHFYKRKDIFLAMFGNLRI